MPEIRIKDENLEGYPVLVQLYHRYVLTADDYLNCAPEELELKKREYALNRRLVLARMPDEEYRILLQTMRSHVIQARIELSREWMYIQRVLSGDGTEYDLYGIEAHTGDAVRYVTSFPKEAKDAALLCAEELFAEREDPSVEIVLCASRYENGAPCSPYKVEVKRWKE